VGGSTVAAGGLSLEGHPLDFVRIERLSRVKGIVKGWGEWEGAVP